MKAIAQKISAQFSRLNHERRKLQWLLARGPTSETVPVYIVGAQRSGTRMLGECLARSPEFRYLGEANRAAFRNFSLRGDETIQRLISGCPSRYIVFRCLKDSHHVSRLLDLNPTSKAIWAYRHYSDRVNSAVRLFGDHPLRAFREWSAGRQVWQMAGVTPEIEGVMREFDLNRLSMQDGAALMWWVRNSLCFTLELDADERVRLWSYDDFIYSPDIELRRLLEFLDALPDASMLEQVHCKSIRKEPAPALAPDIRTLCEDLYQRLERARELRTH